MDDAPDLVGDIVSGLPGRWQAPFLLVVLDGESQRRAATKAGIPRGDIQRWALSGQWRTAARAVQKLLASGHAGEWRTLGDLARRRLHRVLTSKQVAHRDLLKAVEIVLDRTGLPAGATVEDPDAQDGDIPPLHTPEGRAAALAELAALPEELLREAIERRRAAGPAHLRPPVEEP